MLMNRGVQKTSQTALLRARAFGWAREKLERCQTGSRAVAAQRAHHTVLLRSGVKVVS